MRTRSADTAIRTHSRPDSLRRPLTGTERPFSILNVRSTFGEPGEPKPADATARARIRDAAIRRFGVEGFGAGLRAIAADAGVSPALVLHHFGSKDGLRRECDEHVLRVIRDHKAASVGPSGATSAFLALAAIDDLAPLVGYALHSVGAGGATARAFFDHFAADAEEYLSAGVAAGTIKPSRDEGARAVYLTLVGFGAMLLDMSLNPPEDQTDLTSAIRGYLDRSGLASVELFSQGLFSDHRMLDAYLLYVGDPPRQEAGSDDQTP